MGVDKPNAPEINDDLHSTADIIRFEMRNRFEEDGVSKNHSNTIVDYLLKYGVENPPEISEADASQYPNILNAIQGTPLADITETNGFPKGTEAMSAIAPDEYPNALKKIIISLIQGDDIIRAEVQRYEDWCEACEASAEHRKDAFIIDREIDADPDISNFPLPMYNPE